MRAGKSLSLDGKYITLTAVDQDRVFPSFEGGDQCFALGWGSKRVQITCIYSRRPKCCGDSRDVREVDAEDQCRLSVRCVEL